MKAAVDSSVLFDLLAGDSAAATAATQTLVSAATTGGLTVCPVVYAELAAAFQRQQDLDRFLSDTGLQLDAFSPEALWRAGEAWRTYTRRRGRQVQCPRCGQLFDVECPACRTRVTWRQHLIADFLVGGHAVAQAALLIARDRGYFRTYFRGLEVVVPAASSMSD